MTYQADTLQITQKDNYVIVQLDNGKVNAINTPLLLDLKHIFDALDKDDSIRGVVLSGRPNAFSAGLDVMFLSTMDEAGGIHFWECYMRALQSLVQFSKPLVCAITGYAPAGATILTLCTDYRVMARGEKHVVGMHEFKMHMQIPEMLCDVYAYQLGELDAWKAVQQARLYNSDEALEMGLVDESLELEEVLPRAEAYLKKLMVVHPKVYAQSKKYFRKGLYKVVVERDIERIARETIAFNDDDELKAKIAEFMMSLMKKKG